jgi:transcription initiation factor TFIIIB Brf1 subunit/transcription initiation factor TFIIB
MQARTETVCYAQINGGAIMSTSAVAASQDMPPSPLLVSLKRAQERIHILEQENNQLRQEIRWIDKLLAVPASIMSPSHKVTLRAAIKAYLSGTPDEQGLVSIESWKVCKMAGQSKDTFLKNLTYCAEKLSILRKQVERPGLAAGDFSATLSIGITDRLAHPEKYAVATPRQHGGLHEVCPHCHSDRLKKKVIVVCQECGAIISEHTSDINPGANGNLPIENNQETQRQVADECPEPTTPPMGDESADGLQCHNDNQAIAPDQQDQAQQPNQVDLMVAAQLLVEIAGTTPAHIEMSPRGPKKYYDVHRPLEAQDARAHLQGWKTKGGWIRRPDGMTRALAYDADTEEGWEELKTAARFLTYGEYIALLEPSPVGRGGHLWVLYSALVKARDAQRHVCQYAPMLGKVKEYWPGSPNKVRLPGGKYVKPGFAEWCKLYDAYGKLLASNGVEVAQALLIFQNPAEMVPEYPPDPEPSLVKGSDGSTSMPVAPAGDIPSIENQPCTRQENSAQQAQPWVDRRWQEQYGRYLWFQFTPAQLAEWYNARHTVQDILPPARKRYGPGIMARGAYCQCRVYQRRGRLG